MDELWERPLEINVNQIEINLQIFFDLLETPSTYVNLIKNLNFQKFSCL